MSNNHALTLFVCIHTKCGNHLPGDRCCKAADKCWHHAKMQRLSHKFRQGSAVPFYKSIDAFLVSTCAKMSTACDIACHACMQQLTSQAALAKGLQIPIMCKEPKVVNASHTFRIHSSIWMQLLLCIANTDDFMSIAARRVVHTQDKYSLLSQIDQLSHQPGGA